MDKENKKNSKKAERKEKNKNKEKYPIIIKKKNGFQWVIIAALLFVIATDGYFAYKGLQSSVYFILFVIVFALTALSMWVNYSRDIYLKENKIEFYTNKNVTDKIKYSSITSLTKENGKESNKKKSFYVINYNETSGKKKSKPKQAQYFINPSNYSIADFKEITRIIQLNNPAVTLDEEISASYSPDKKDDVAAAK